MTAADAAGQPSPARLEIRMLGGFVALHPSGEPVRFSTRKAKALLACLALRPGQTQTRGKLATLLWSRTGDAQAHASLRQTLATLRKALGAQDVLLAGPEGLLLAAGRFEVDVNAFERCAAQGSLEALGRAADLYRGELLEGLALAEEPFEEWLAAERERLRTLALDVLDRLIAKLAAAGDVARGIHAAQRLLALDPLDEATHRALMRFYVRQGRTGAALQQFELCTQRLRRELGVGPEAETKALYAELVRLRASRAWSPPQFPASPGAPEGADPPASTSLEEGERKRVTVLVAGVVSSSAPTAWRDPEEMREALAPALAALSAAARRFGGTVSGIPGEGIMAVFGAPAACEDHALRACCAALAMRDAMTGASSSAGAPARPPLQTRIGIGSGDIVTSPSRNVPGTHDTYGPPMALAARLKDLVRPGEIWLAAEAVGHAEGFIEVEPVSAAGLGHGPEDLPPCWRLTGVVPSGRRFRAALARGLSAFVGRSDELRTLGRALERAGAGRGQIVALAGEPGVGKSRLVHEFVRSAASNGWLVLEAGATSGGANIPYFPIVELFKRYFAIGGDEDSWLARDRVADALVAVDEASGALLDPLSVLLDLPVDDPRWAELDPRQRRSRTLEAVEAVFFGLARAQPLVVVVEDLHWVDAETRAVLDLLVEGLAGAAMLLLVNYRPEFRHEWHTKTYYTQLHVDPLRQESAEALLGTLMGGDPALDGLKRELIARTQGNPLFLEECVRALVEAGTLAGGRGAYGLGRAAGVEVPPTIQDVIAARIDRLPADQKRLLQATAVIGKTARLDVLGPVLGYPTDQLERDLRDLQGAEFLYPLSRFPHREYAFKHVLTQEVAYGSLLRSTRQSFHERIARVLAERFPEVGETQPEVLALHLGEAGLAGEAVPFWRRAAERALERSANVEAISHLTKALALLGDLPAGSELGPHELDLLIALGPALIATRGFTDPEVERTYLRARALCREVGGPTRLVPVLVGLANIHLLRGEFQQARELGEQCLGLPRNPGDPDVLAAAHRVLGAALHFLGAFDRARAQLEQGIALLDGCRRRFDASLYLSDSRVHCRSLLARVLWALGYPEQAVRVSDGGLRLAEELGHNHTLAQALSLAAGFHLDRRDVRRTERLAEELVALATEHGFPYWRATASLWQGWALVQRRETGEGLVHLRQSLAHFRAKGDALTIPHGLTVLAEACGRAGEPEEGLRALAEALAVVERTGERRREAEVHRLRGELLLLLRGRDEAEAATCFGRAIAIARNQSARALELRAATSLARLWHDRGQRREAYDLLAPVYGWFTEGFDTQDLKDAEALLGELS